MNRSTGLDGADRDDLIDEEKTRHRMHGQASPRPPRDDGSPFFWWVRALLAAGFAVTIFPIVFAVVMKVSGV